MAITEIVRPSLKQTPESVKAFSSTLGPYLQKILDEAPFKPKQRVFGKVILENGIDVSADFKPCLGLEWESPDHFHALITGEGFKAFGPIVKPYSAAPPNPQLFETDLGPSEVFAGALTEVWQVKIGDSKGKEEEAREAWRNFIGAMATMEVDLQKSSGIQGTSLNQEEKLWIGVLGWESSEIREKVLGSAAVKEAKNVLGRLLSNNFVAAFAQPSKL